MGEIRPKAFVSIVIPAKNEMENIGRILSDLTKQTYPADSYEVVVIDDESSDDTVRIVNDFIGYIPNTPTFCSSEGVESSLRYKKRTSRSRHP